MMWEFFYGSVNYLRIIVFKRFALCVSVLFWLYESWILNTSCSYSFSLTYQPGQPILSHPPIHLHVPGVDKYGAAQLLCCLDGKHTVRCLFINGQITISHFSFEAQVYYCTITHVLGGTLQACTAVLNVSQQRKDAVQLRPGPSCLYVIQSALLGNQAPLRSASSPEQPSQGLAWAAFPGRQTSWGGFALSGPNHHLKGHRDPRCHEVLPVITSSD